MKVKEIFIGKKLDIILTIICTGEFHIYTERLLGMCTPKKITKCDNKNCVSYLNGEEEEFTKRAITLFQKRNVKKMDIDPEEIMNDES